MQRSKIDLGVYGGGLGIAMTKDLPYLAQRGSVAEHLSGQRVAQQVRSLEGRFDACALQGTEHYATDSAWTKQFAPRCARSDEHIARGARGTRIAQVIHQGRTYISWHRQPVTALSRAANSNGTLIPIEVVQPQLDNLAGAQPEPRKQQQDGVITTSDGRSPIAPGKQPVHLRRRYRLGDSRHRPVRYRRHTGTQVCLDITKVAAVLQKRAQGRGHDLGPLRMVQTRRIRLYKANDVRSGDLAEPNFAVGEGVLEKASDRVAVQADRGCGQPTLARQVELEFLTGSQGRCRRSRLLGLNCTISGSEPEKRMKRKGVAASAASMQPSMIQILTNVPSLDARAIDLALVEPGREVLHKRVAILNDAGA